MQDYLFKILPTANILKITPDELQDLEKGKLIPSRDLIVEFCKTLNIPELKLIKADDFSRSVEEVELLELVEKRNLVVNGTLSILNKHGSIERTI